MYMKKSKLFVSYKEIGTLKNCETPTNNQWNFLCTRSRFPFTSSLRFEIIFMFLSLSETAYGHTSYRSSENRWLHVILSSVVVVLQEPIIFRAIFINNFFLFGFVRSPQLDSILRFFFSSFPFFHFPALSDILRQKCAFSPTTRNAQSLIKTRNFSLFFVQFHVIRRNEEIFRFFRFESLFARWRRVSLR